MKRSYKPKECEACGAVFAPRAPIAKYCDVCRPEQERERNRKYRAEHLEQEREWHRKYHAEHLEQARERDRKYCAEQRESRDFFAVLAAADAVKRAM